MFRKLLIALALLVAVSAQSPGCSGTICYLAVDVDTTGFSPSLQIGFTTPSGAFLSTSGPAGTADRTYYVQTPFNQALTVTATFREGATFFAYNMTWNPQNSTTYRQRITQHRATLTIHLEKYNPSNVGNELPSFAGNNWAVKLTTGSNFEVFREYYDGGGSNFPCTSNGTLPLASLTNGATQPFANAFSVVVLPYSDIKVWKKKKTKCACEGCGFSKKANN